MVYEMNDKPFEMQDNKGEGHKSRKNERANVNMVVSDAMAKNSRQLLYAHIYNYLIENKRYETAKQFLMEADVPISEEYKVDGNHDNLPKMELDSRDLLPAKMLMDCSQTFLLEWWECFSSLHSYVETNPSDALREKHPEIEPVIPLLPSKAGAYNLLVSEPPNLSSSTSSALPPQNVANTQLHNHETTPHAYNILKFNSGQSEKTNMDRTTAAHDPSFSSQTQQEQEQVLGLNSKQEQQRQQNEQGQQRGQREQQWQQKWQQKWMQQHGEYLQESHQEQYQGQNQEQRQGKQRQQQHYNSSPQLQQPQHYYWQQNQQPRMLQQRSVQIDEYNTQPSGSSTSSNATVPTAGTTSVTSGLGSDLNLSNMQGTGYSGNNDNATMILQQQLQQQLQKLQLLGMSSFNNLGPSPIINMMDPNIQQQYMAMLMMNNSLQYPQQVPIHQNEYLDNNNNSFKNMSNSSMPSTSHTPPNSGAPQTEDIDIMKATSTSLPVKHGTGGQAFTFLNKRKRKLKHKYKPRYKPKYRPNCRPNYKPRYKPNYKLKCKPNYTHNPNHKNLEKLPNLWNLSLKIT